MELESYIYEVPTAHSSFGGRWIFFLCAHPSIASELGEKRLRKAPHSHLSRLGFPVCQGILVIDGSRGEQRGDTHSVEGCLVLGGFPQKGFRPETASDPLPILHPSERRLTAGPGRGVRGDIGYI